MKVRFIELLAIILILTQIVITSAAFSLDPIIEQEEFGLLLAMNFILTSILLYMYFKEPDVFPEKVLELDEEWIALGIAMVFLISLFIYIK
jgi:hypothetical protein